MPHPDDGLIEEYLDGELTPGAAAELEAHVAACGACGDRLQAAGAARMEADELVAMLGEPEPRAGDGELPASLRRPPRRPVPWRTLGWAASLVLAAGLGYAGGALEVGTPESREVGRSDGREVERSDGRTVRQSDGPEIGGAVAPQPAEPPGRRLAEPSAEPPRRAAEEAAVRTGAASAEFGAPTEAEARLDEPAEAQAKALADAAELPSRRAAEFDAEPASLDVAVRALGGSIRLLDGLEVKRVAVSWLKMPDGDSAASVELTYADQAGRRILLRQSRTTEPGARLEAAELARQRAPAAQAVAPQAAAGRDMLQAQSPRDGEVEWTDLAGFRLLLRADADADSLARLRARVR